MKVSKQFFAICLIAIFAFITQDAFSYPIGMFGVHEDEIEKISPTILLRIAINKNDFISVKEAIEQGAEVDQEFCYNLWHQGKPLGLNHFHTANPLLFTCRYRSDRKEISDEILRSHASFCEGALVGMSMAAKMDNKDVPTLIKEYLTSSFKPIIFLRTKDKSKPKYPNAIDQEQQKILMLLLAAGANPYQVSEEIPKSPFEQARVIRNAVQSFARWHFYTAAKALFSIGMPGEIVYECLKYHDGHPEIFKQWIKSKDVTVALNNGKLENPSLQEAWEIKDDKQKLFLQRRREVLALFWQKPAIQKVKNSNCIIS